MKPIVLEPNRPARFYRGGAAISELRGGAQDDPYMPEDWVGSTTTAYGEESLGLTLLDGVSLRDRMKADPELFLGRAHLEQYGSDPALLVKLLDAAERLPVHVHPSREFSRRHLDCPYGKTEAWVIIGTRGAEPLVNLGFRHDVPSDLLRSWIDQQDVEAMLKAMHQVPVRPGDSVFVPAGIPHAIGEGVFLVELQEPTDWSVLLEWKGYAIDGQKDGHLALGFDVALECVDRSGWSADRVAYLKSEREKSELRPGINAFFPAEADEFFRAERVHPGPEVALDAGFSLLIVLEGEGFLHMESGHRMSLNLGDTLLIPHAAGPVRVEGKFQAIRCRPPAA